MLCLEQNARACERLTANTELNGVQDRVRVERVNCMSEMRARADAGDQYGLVIVDPPAFARNRKQLSGAERGYVELNRRGLSLTRPGGRLVTASCSYAVHPADFLTFLGRAAHLAGREAWVEQLLGAAPDHPHRITLPESAYLKCAFLRVG